MHPIVWLRTLSCCLAAVVAIVASPPKSLFAQGTEVVPFIGLYAPLSNLFEEDEFEAKHGSGLSFGARVVYRGASRLGFEGAFSYSSSEVEVSATDNDDISIDFDANVIIFRGKVLYDLSQPQGRVRPHIGAGIAAIIRGGDFYDETDLEGTTDLGFVLAAGLRFPVGERLMLSVELEDFISSAKFEQDDDESDAKLQNDLLLSVGLAIPIGRQR
ncbi:MAG TPA: outer membrane beta-barrel protein [Gemmatimonadaceae bacterium]|nr:outer membrane beta-barrel protein [Gemmatimonadaceae bacterium]